MDISYRDSINVATREVDYHFIMHFDKDVTVTPAVDVLKVNIDDHFGGLLTVEEEVVAPGEKVVINNETNPGCKLKQIRTFPENIVTITADDVDATTGSGKYSFIMPNTQVTLNQKDADRLQQGRKRDCVHQSDAGRVQSCQRSCL